MDIGWLQPPESKGQKASRTDILKRQELFHELLYFVFDSVLIPLIRSNFYVTESNTHGNQLFYFRHDVWRLIAEPSMTNIKDTMFEEMKTNEALETLGGRRLGFGQIRLLPKGNKLRPLMNLKRRIASKGSSATLAPSINSILAPIHTLLKLEKVIVATLRLCFSTDRTRPSTRRNSERQCFPPAKFTAG